MTTGPSTGRDQVAASIADGVQVGLWLLGADGASLYRNLCFESKLGAFERLAELAPWLPGVPLEAYADRVLAGGESIDEPAVLLRRPNGVRELFELRLEPGPPASTVLVSLSEVGARARVQRLGALVETAISLAHELSNPLAILRGELELLQRDLPADAGHRLTKMTIAAERIHSVLERMRSLGQTTPVDYLRSRGVKMIDLSQPQSARGAVVPDADSRSGDVQDPPHTAARTAKEQTG
jgi:nitrogen-specific signal transduction histidine kinase